MILSLDAMARAERDFAELLSAGETPDDLFQREWALLVLSRALEAFRKDFPRPEEYDLLRDFVQGAVSAERKYSALAESLGVSEAEARKRVHRARRRYRDCILAEIQTYAENKEMAQEELADLFAAFGKRR